MAIEMDIAQKIRQAFGIVDSDNMKKVSKRNDEEEEIVDEDDIEDDEEQDVKLAKPSYRPPQRLSRQQPDEEEEAPMQDKQIQPPTINYMQVVNSLSELGMGVADVDIIKNKNYPEQRVLVLLDAMGNPRIKVVISRAVLNRIIERLNQDATQ